MILVKPSHKILAIYGLTEGQLGNESLKLIELAGRTCYKSEDKITDGSALRLTSTVLNRGHESVIEHSAMTVRFICDRGVTHELVRHRLCAFSQESTRYCNYKGGVTFVIPPWVDILVGTYDIHYPIGKTETDETWSKSCWEAELSYQDLLYFGWSPQQARSVLPNSLKTEIVVTANFREWRHIFKLRCSKAAHPQMREIMIPLLKECRDLIPVIFEDITY